MLQRAQSIRRILTGGGGGGANNNASHTRSGSGSVGESLFDRSVQNLALLKEEFRISNFESENDELKQEEIRHKKIQLFGDFASIYALLPYVCEFLDAKSLARICNINTEYQQIAQTPHLWKSLLKSDFLHEHEQLAPVENLRSFLKRGLSLEFATQATKHPKDEYVDMLLKRKAEVEEQARRKEVRKCSAWCNFMQEPFSLVFILVSILSFLVLLVMRLSSDESVYLTWTVWWPLCILVVLFLSSFVWYLMVLSRKFDNLCHFDLDSIRRNFGMVPGLMNNFVIRNHENPSWLAVSYCTSITLALITSGILLFLKTTNYVTGLTYLTVMIPIFVVLGLSCVCGPLSSCNACIPTGADTVIGRIATMIVWMIFLVPYWLTPLLLALKLDGTLSIKMWAVLIPYFVIDFLGLVLFVFAANFGGFIMWLCCFGGPIVAFEVLLAVRNWNENTSVITITILFIPLFVFFGCWTLSASVIAGALVVGLPKRYIVKEDATDDADNDDDLAGVFVPINAGGGANIIMPQQNQQEV
jgi:hypothetical protein